MDIHGNTIDGDPDGLQYLIEHAVALQRLIDEVRAAGSASFLYRDRRFVVLPTARNTFMVTESHNRTAPGISGALRRL